MVRRAISFPPSSRLRRLLKDVTRTVIRWFQNNAPLAANVRNDGIVEAIADEDSQSANGPWMGEVAVSSRTLKIVRTYRRVPAFVHAQPPREIEACAELGRYSRLTGSLRFPVPAT